MRKALIVGIDHYESVPRLHGCVNDAQSVNAVLEKHGDGSPNFDVKLFTATAADEAISRGDLKDVVTDLFSGDSEIALFYFAGHGHIEAIGGYLCTSECRRGDEGLSLGEVLSLATNSKARNKVIVLDSCHSAIAGTNPIAPQLSELTHGMTILSASTEEQYASEEDGCGVFTALFVDALGGAAANVVGEVTPGSVYAHIDQSLGSWEQRPVFKTNVKSFVSLRKVKPPISHVELRRMSEFFPTKNFEFRLNPTFEPERPAVPEPGVPPPNPKNNETFAILQNYNRVNLLVPVDAPHMWHAAMNSKSCKLTFLGEHYRRLAAKGRI